MILQHLVSDALEDTKFWISNSFWLKTLKTEKLENCVAQALTQDWSLFSHWNKMEVLTPILFDRSLNVWQVKPSDIQANTEKKVVILLSDYELCRQQVHTSCFFYLLMKDN